MGSILQAALRALGPGRAARAFRRWALRAWALAFWALLGVGAIGPASAEPRGHQPRIDTSGRPKTGVASYYGKIAAGKTTASGAGFAPNRLTAASRTLPLGTKARVTSATTGKSVQVTVTDRGPFAKNRILDVSPNAARRLGMTVSGVSTVTVQPLHAPGPPHGRGQPDAAARRRPAPA